MMEKARVIRVACGAEGLRAAIESGVLAVDAQRAYKRVLEENEALLKENERLRLRLAQAEAINAREREIQIEAMRRILMAEGKKRPRGGRKENT